MDQQKPNNNFVIAALSLVTLGVVGFAYYKYAATPETSMQLSNGTTKIEEVAQEIKPMATFKNGKYTVLGDYVSPGGPEQIEVTVTLESGMVKDANVVSKATLPGSINFQSKFIGGFKEFVIGKNIDEIKLDKVAGSSLTPKGFNDALEKIMTQAQS